MSNWIDLTGQRFGHLRVIRHLDQRNGQTLWVCCCDCGRIVHRASHSLQIGNENTACEHCHRSEGRLVGWQLLYRKQKGQTIQALEVQAFLEALENESFDNEQVDPSWTEQPDLIFQMIWEMDD